MPQSIMKKFTTSLETDVQSDFKQENFKMIVHTPKNFDDVQVIADDLLKKSSVLIHFDAIDAQLKCRIFDYMNGFSYALEAQVEKISDDIILYVPQSAVVESETPTVIKGGKWFNF